MPAPAILMGDFNMTPRSPEYESLVGALDPIEEGDVKQLDVAEMLLLSCEAGGGAAAA